jgi:hypothetical protein
MVGIKSARLESSIFESAFERNRISILLQAIPT